VKKITLLIPILFLIFFTVNVQAVAFIANPEPDDGETGISYTSNVSTCVKILSGCSAYIRFYENSSGVWVEYQNLSTAVGGACGNFSISNCETTYYWKVVAKLNCSGKYYWENHTFSFTTEACPISNEIPINGSAGVCPCCDAICIDVYNPLGNNMNMTIYGSYNTTFFKTWNIYQNITNGTYCFCMCSGFYIDGYIKPMQYNTTYYWYVNVTDNMGFTNQSNIFSFTTASNPDLCPCGGRGDIEVYDDYGLLGIIGLIGLLSFIIVKKNIGGD